MSPGLLDINITIDLKESLDIEGGKLFAQYNFRHGPNGSDDTAEMQAYSNIDANRMSRAKEIWYEQRLFRDVVRIKLGQVDANTEFDYVAAAAEFINSSAGISPTLLNVPTYPDPAVSANLFLYPLKWLYAGVGAFTENVRHLSESSFNHPYLIGEVGFAHDLHGWVGPGRIAFGVWHDTHEQDRFDGGTEDAASGIYAIAEEEIWREIPSDESENRSVSVFAQYGDANKEISSMRRHISLGLAANGPLSCRKQDSAGIYWSEVFTSRVPGSGENRDETVIESFYNCRVTPFLSLKPDLQYILNPGGGSTLNHSIVATIRVTILL